MIQSIPEIVLGTAVRTLVEVPLRNGGKWGVNYMLSVADINSDGVTVSRDNVKVLVKPDTLKIAHKIANGTYYDVDTPDKVVNLLETARLDGTSLRLHYGNIETGRDWLDEHDVTGTIGRSMGPIKSPLIIANRRDIGSGALIDASIVKIRTTGKNARTLYQHPKYHTGVVTMRTITPSDVVGETRMNLHNQGYTTAVDVDGNNQAMFKSMENAQRYVKKMGLTVTA